MLSQMDPALVACCDKIGAQGGPMHMPDDMEGSTFPSTPVVQLGTVTRASARLRNVQPEVNLDQSYEVLKRPKKNADAAPAGIETFIEFCTFNASTYFNVMTYPKKKKKNNQRSRTHFSVYFEKRFVIGFLLAVWSVLTLIFCWNLCCLLFQYISCCQYRGICTLFSQCMVFMNESNLVHCIEISSSLVCYFHFSCHPLNLTLLIHTIWIHLIQCPSATWISFFLGDHAC